MLAWLTGNPTIGVSLIGLVAGTLGWAASRAFSLSVSSWEAHLASRRLIERVSVPILVCLNDLSARMSGINRLVLDAPNDWLDSPSFDERQIVPFVKYYYSSTLYVFLRLIHYVELIRVEQLSPSFSHYGKAKIVKSYVDLLYQAMSDPALTGSGSNRSSEAHWIFYHNISIVSELFSTTDAGGARRPLTFREFCLKYNDPQQADFHKWIAEVEGLFNGLSHDKAVFRWQRLTAIWFYSEELALFLDPRGVIVRREAQESLNSIQPQFLALLTDRARRLGLSLPRLGNLAGTPTA